MEMLCFRLPGHGDTTLKHMNSLRSRQHFCDITIVASNNQTFKGHKVVLAACSPFLRDQFLLNPSPKLQVSMLYSSTVVCDLLQSCYTGVLQFNPEEIVNYLTAASYLQMEHIVERCRGALKKYMQLKNPSAPKVSKEINSDYIEEQMNRYREEERGAPSDEPQDGCYPETEDIVITGGGSDYVSVELPQLDFSMASAQGEKISPMTANSLNQYSLEDSSGAAGEGSSRLTTVGANEGGDESVAVVGSTSSVAGPVICEHCGMTFPSAHSLALHSRSTHLLYACPCCGKHFHHSANLTRHMCPLCYKAFTQKSTLIDHMNLHSGERPHRCAYCHAHFAHKPALRRHLKEQHGKTTGQNSQHEQEEIERARGAAGRIREEEQECLVTEQVS
uniref:Zinc finger and BTB domain containing 12, tandem duplicate 1 n=1 Tax=Monopterus albus TaxID=43700 RepID=A0A3Q3JM12_MONAL